MENKTSSATNDLSLTRQFIQGWVTLLEYWDKNAVEHGRRVASVSLNLARYLGWRDNDLTELEWGALLHDVGKVCVPPTILFNPGPLSEQDWIIVKRHPVFGYEMLHPVQTMKLSAGIVLCHHESWDGSGYPQGLSGSMIPPGARIVAIAEVWDALTSNPADHADWPKQRVTAYIREHAGTKFDPAVVVTFLNMNEAG